MPIVELLAVAVALAMDAFTVAVASGVSLRCVSWRQTLRLSFHFGLFQALMPVAGWGLGLSVRSHIERFDHWVAFGLLAFIGARMIRESFAASERGDERCDPTRGMTLVMLSVATSIDALAVGLSMAVLGVSVWYPAVVIGVVAFAFTAAGLHIGRKVGEASRFSSYAEAVGGAVLIAIGVKVLIEHGVFG